MKAIGANEILQMSLSFSIIFALMDWNVNFIVSTFSSVWHQTKPVILKAF